MMDSLEPYNLSDNEGRLEKQCFFPAFESYISLCDEFLTAAYAGEPIDIHNLPQTVPDTRQVKIVKIIHV